MRSDDSNAFRDELERALPAFGLPPLAEKQLDQLTAHYSLMMEWNRRVNLTRIEEPAAAARFHYAESLFGCRFIAGARSVLDVGSGAGFPVVPMAVLEPGVRFTALDSNLRKTVFLEEVRDLLGLQNLDVVRARIENYDWSGYDLLVSRALDRGEALWISVLMGLGGEQRLMLFGGSDLVFRLVERVRPTHRVVTHAIPLSEERVVSIFSKA
jgi:16S rRNA (guanine(527)-N(7))-methyltransferase RsmG